MAKHIFKGTTAPTFAPKQVGHHFVNTANGDTYISVGTTSSADWKIVSLSIDDKAKVSATDTTSGYLLAKLSSGSGIALTEQNIGGNETLQISVTGAALTDEKVKISATDTTTGYLQAKVLAGTGITVTQENISGNEDLRIATTITQYTDENAQDAIGNILTDTASIDFTYNDAGNNITAAVLPAGVDHNSLANFVANKHIDHTLVNISTGTGLTGGGDISASRTISLANTAVTAGTYGSATQAPQIIVDAQGRIISASNITISIPSTQISDFNEASQDAVGNILIDSASVDFTYNDALNTITAVVLPAGVNHNLLQNYVVNEHINHSTVSISAGSGLSGGGDITASRTISMPNVGTAGTYGSTTQIPAITTDAQGRISAATNTPISIPSSQVNDFAESVDDRVAALVQQGAGITVTYNDPANTLTIASNITQYTDEMAQDTIAVLIQNGTGISWVYNDALNTLTPTVSLSPFSTTNLAEGTNLYFTNSRAQNAISVTDSGSIDFTYTVGNITGIVLPAGVDHNSLNNFVANKHIDHSTVSLIAGTGISATGLGDLTASRTINLANTGVTAATYGSATQVPVETVNAQGQITGVINTAIAIPSTQITDFSEAAQDAVGGILTDTASIDFTYNDAGNQITAVVLPAGVDHNSLNNYVANKHIDHSTVSISAGAGLSGGGDITASRTISMPNVGTAGTYGDSTHFPIITTDAQGRVTSVTVTAADSYWVDNGSTLTWADQTGMDLEIRQAGATGSAYVRQISSNGTLAVPTAVTSGQRLGGNGYYGWNSTGMDGLPSAAIDGYATENHTATAQGGELIIEVIPNGTVTPVQTAFFRNNGDLDINGGLHVGNTVSVLDGDIKYTGTEFQMHQNGVWAIPCQIPTYLSATAAVTTTSATFAVVGSMTTTPAAGTYKLDFTCAAALSASTSTGDFGVFIAGVEQAQCRRTIGNGSGIAIANSIAISTIVTVTGAQVLTIQFRENAAATLTVNAREFILTPISR
jgi:hypothetical protein